jgi:hypothetical protein
VRSRSARATSVFVNTPFDVSYQSQFIALLAAIIAVGRTPRCVLEVAEVGLGRLARLLDLMADCEVSIHDLSRVGLPARFNMPFELGLACAVAELKPPHAFILLEKVPYRIQVTLSDMNGRDPYIHGGTIRGAIDSVLNALRPTTGAPTAGDVFRLYGTMRVAAESITNHGRNGSIFTRSRFLDLVAVGVERAAQTGLIAR